jgi:D-tagatose-1,6-bisphosphate aldolase subunit GatZ/KbaZ
MSRHPLLQVLKAQKAGHASGIYSVCSANRFVLDAALTQAVRDGSCVCIEATSNQVDQFGGYTGMTPLKFAGLVREMARKAGLPSARVVLGGDHLGPNTWRNEPASSAMAKARDLVRAYARAGFTKIHLDASMPCADDSAGGREHLDNRTVAERAADLCAAAEKAATGPGKPLYIFGTEVPMPGGARDALEGVQATLASAAKETIEVTRNAFCVRGMEAAWERVVALVVQPGVEFGDASVVPYDRGKAAKLSAMIEQERHLVYEAHSTDYQVPDCLRRMVEDHFAILKVGPELTFALREAVFALCAMEEELAAGKRSLKPSCLRKAIEEAMLANPVHWKKYYHGTAAEQAYARQYSFSDRMRYYWPQPLVNAALKRLLANLSRVAIPMTLLSRHMPGQYAAVRENRLDCRPESLIRDKIMEITGKYALACGMGRHQP